MNKTLLFLFTFVVRSVWRHSNVWTRWFAQCKRILTSSLGGFLVSLTEPSWTNGRNRRRLISSVRLLEQLKFDPVSKTACKMCNMNYTVRQVYYTQLWLSQYQKIMARGDWTFFPFFLQNTKMTWLYVKDNLKRNYLSKANSWVWSIDTLKWSRGAWCCNFCWNNFCESIIRSHEAWLQKSFAPTGNVSLIIFAEYSSNI